MLAKTVRFIYEMCQLNVKITFLKRKPFAGCLKHPDDFAYYNKQTGFAGYPIHDWIVSSIGSWNYCFDVIIMVYDLIQKPNDSCVYKKVSESALTIVVQQIITYFISWT